MNSRLPVFKLHTRVVQLSCISSLSLLYRCRCVRRLSHLIHLRVSGLCLLLQTLFRFHTRRNSYTTWANPKLVELRPNLQIISLTYCSESSNPQALVHFMNPSVDADRFNSLQFFNLGLSCETLLF